VPMRSVLNFSWLVDTLGLEAHEQDDVHSTRFGFQTLRHKQHRSPQKVPDGSRLCSVNSCKFVQDDPPSGARARSVQPSHQSQNPSGKTQLDPRDFDWCPPSDEDQPWRSRPNVHVGVPICNTNGVARTIGQLLMQHAGPVQCSSGERVPATTLSCQDSADGAEFKCAICFSNDVKEVVTFSCGVHLYCIQCATQYFKARLDQGCTARCPAEGCGVEATLDLVQKLLSERELDTYMLVHMRQEQRIHDCPQCCSSILVVGRREESSASELQSLRCPQCHHRLCMNCGLSWHDRCSCSEARARAHRRSQRDRSHEFDRLLQMLGWKRCPRCYVACEKSDPKACDHMTCTLCCHEFCWTCLADMKVIFAHGNHFHNRSCPFYREYHGPNEYLPKSCPQCMRFGRACSPMKM